MSALEKLRRLRITGDSCRWSFRTDVAHGHPASFVNQPRRTRSVVANRFRNIDGQRTPCRAEYSQGANQQHRSLGRQQELRHDMTTALLVKQESSHEVADQD